MKKLLPPQRRIDSSLNLLKHLKDTKKLPTVRQIEVAEISSNLENHQHDESTKQKIPNKLFDVNRTTRIAKKLLSMQVS